MANTSQKDVALSWELKIDRMCTISNDTRQIVPNCQLSSWLLAGIFHWCRPVCWSELKRKHDHRGTFQSILLSHSCSNQQDTNWRIWELSFCWYVLWVCTFVSFGIRILLASQTWLSCRHCQTGEISCAQGTGPGALRLMNQSVTQSAICLLQFGGFLYRIVSQLSSWTFIFGFTYPWSSLLTDKKLSVWFLKGCQNHRWHCVATANPEIWNVDDHWIPDLKNIIVRSLTIRILNQKKILFFYLRPFPMQFLVDCVMIVNEV